MVNYLLSIGADVNAPPCQKYVSTLQAAVANGHGRFIDTLIEAGADVNAYYATLGTALISSARYANKKWSYLLLDLGADPHLIGGPYGSALHAAARDGELAVVERLLDEGADVNLVAGKYGHILQAACNPRGDVDYLPCVRLLIQRGSDVNARGGKYETALQSAAKRGKLEAVTILLDHGADPFARGGKFGTAMEAAKVNEHWHIFNYIGRFIRHRQPGSVFVPEHKKASSEKEIAYSPRRG
jgi:ankyrin repeat protein